MGAPAPPPAAVNGVLDGADGRPTPCRAAAAHRAPAKAACILRKDPNHALLLVGTHSSQPVTNGCVNRRRRISGFVAGWGAAL